MEYKQYINKRTGAVFALAIMIAGAVTLQNQSKTVVTQGLYAESVSNLSKQADNSDIVITGTVQSIGDPNIEFDQLENARIKDVYRTVSVRPERFLKGNETGEIRIRTYGGQKGDVNHEVEYSAQYRQGEKALFFLENMGDYYVAKGGKYGKYTIQDGSISKKMISENTEKQVSVDAVENMVSPS